MELVDFNRVALWSTIQLGLAIICSCLPTYGPVFKHVASLFRKESTVLLR